MSMEIRSGSLHVLVVEDNPGDVDLIRELFADVADGSTSLRDVRTLSGAVELLDHDTFDAVLLDLNLPDSSGLETLDAVLDAAPDVPVIVLTGVTGEELGLAAVRRGAADFLPKGDLTGRLLVRSMRYARERRRRARSETRFRALIENSRDLVAILDTDFEVRYVSPSLSRVLGFEPEERIGESALGEVHPDDRHRVIREGRRVLEDPSYTARLQYRVRHSDGSWRVLDTVAQNCVDEPDLGGLVLNSWDITDLRRTQDELEAARNRFEILQSVSATANEADGLEQALRILVAELPGKLGWDVAHAYVLEDGRLRSLPVWFPEDGERFEGFRRASSDADFGPGHGLVGAALESGRVEHMGDLPRNEEFVRRDAAGAIERGVVIPVSADEDVVAVLELFSTRKEPVDDRLLELARDIGTQLGRVAERDRALRTIQESRNLLRQLVEGVPDAMFVKDRQGRYVLINEGGAELIGQTPDAVIGRTDRELFEPESAEAVVRNDRRVVEEAETFHYEEEITDVHGTTRSYLVTKGPIRDPDGRVAGLFGISRDVTELKRAQADLQERMKELRALYAASHELTRTDVPLERRLGELVDLVPGGWLYPRVTEARITCADQVFQTDGFRETPWTLSEEIVSRDQVVGRLDVAVTEERPERDHGPFLKEERELLDGLALAVGEAIERERLEKEFIQAQKMEAVGRLSGGVAHDFNNLLTVIRAHTDFLLMDLAASDPLADEVQAIQDASNRAAELTNQLLAFSKEQVLRPRVLDLNDVVRSIERLAARVLGEDIRIETDLADDLPAVEVDPAQLEQALLNLAVNARDAMPDGGVLTLATAAEELSAGEAAGRSNFEPGTYGRLLVSDTGVGMDEETRARVFEPFFSTKGRQEGTGLGLAMVYGIVTQSGGAIEVESAPGEGSTFVLRFPAVDDAPEALDRDVLPAALDSDVTGRILVIEDDASVRRVTEAILRRADFDVEAAPDAESGLEALDAAGGDFDVVLTDLVLPGISGRELIDRLREKSSDVRLVAMSGYAEGSPGRRGNLAADVLFIQKPFSPEALLEVVREAMARQAA